MITTMGVAHLRKALLLPNASLGSRAGGGSSYCAIAVAAGERLFSSHQASATAPSQTALRSLSSCSVSRQWTALPAASLSTMIGGTSAMFSSASATSRTFSTRTTMTTATTDEISGNNVEDAAISPRQLKELEVGYWTKPVVVHKPDGSTVLAFRTGYHPKLKPRLVARRLQQCRIYEGKEKDIRGSEFKLNIVCQTIAGLPLEEALHQLRFMKKVKAPLVSKVLQRTANLADIRDCLPYCALEVAECFATKGTVLKRVNFHGRGRMGRMEHRYGHLRVVLREIDFPLKLYQAHEVAQKKYWYKLQQRALELTNRRLAEREEQVRLERENAQKIASKKK